MTLAHLLFAAGMSLYILIAVRYEERDLVTHLGKGYADYKEQVPMFVPRPGKIHSTVKPGVGRPVTGGMR